MKAIVKAQRAVGAQLQDLPVPEIQPDEMLVKVLATGICGSDRDSYEWRPNKHGLQLPVTMGHEFFGEVVKVGSHVSGYKVGDRISSDSHMPCGECYLCRTGKAHLCMKRGVLGFQKNGCFAEYVALPAVAAFKMPGDTKPEYGALMEPMGVAFHAAMKTSLSGKKVLVIGLGALGYMIKDFAKMLGATRVIVCSTNDKKIQQCLDEGSDYGVNSKTEDVVAKVLEYTDGNGADVVFEMTGANHLYNLGLDCCAYGGTMVEVGVPSEGNAGVTIDDYFNRVMAKEINIEAIFGRYFYDTWELMKDLLETGKLRPEKYVGGVIKLEEFEKGFQMAKTSIGRIIMIPPHED